MAVKKRGKKSVKKATKKAVKKKAVKKVSKKSVRRASPAKASMGSGSSMVKPTGRRMNLVTRNLFLFIILGVISWVLSAVSGTAEYQQFFLFLSFILGAIALAFLVSLLVLVFLRVLRRR